MNLNVLAYIMRSGSCSRMMVAEKYETNFAQVNSRANLVQDRIHLSTSIPVAQSTQ